MISIICNPVSGNIGRKKDLAQEIGKVLEQNGLAYSVTVSEYPGHAPLIARQAVLDGCDTVMALGGDGTVSEIAGALVDTNVSFAIIPAGTGNDYCKTIGIPQDPMKALDVFLKESPKRTDAGIINGRVFINEVGTGFDVDVLRRSVRFKKHPHGLLPYLIGVISALIHYHTYPVSFKTDSGTVSTEDLTVYSVALGRIIGGGIPIAPEADPVDGLFDVSGIRSIRPIRLPARLIGLLGGKILTFPETFRSRAAYVEFSSPGMYVNVDGEVLPMDRAEVKILPGALLIHRPAFSGEKDR